MNTQPEIKAGQRWRFPKDGFNKSTWDGSTAIAEVKLVDDHFVYLRDTKKREAYTVTVDYFQEYYEPCPEPKTRPITADDVMKMLAVNPVLFHRDAKKDPHWYQSTARGLWLHNHSDILHEYQFSHNPFAPNAKIVGPEIEVGE
jgi:hypothetical protein